MLSKDLFDRVTRAGWLIAAAVAVVSWPVSSLLWAAAVLVGFSWIYLNFFFLVRLLETGLTPMPAAPKRILLLATFKFPVIYLAGFFVLRTRVFPTGGILTGLTVFFAALIAVRLMGKHSRSSGAVAV